MKVEHAMMLEDITDAIRSRSSGASRYVVGVAGPPGSGKSTLAESVLAGLKASGEAAAMVPMDGFHLDNAILNKRNLLARKGAPQTFDVDGFVHLLSRLASGENAVYPLFDRATDRSIAGAAEIEEGCQTILVEGNYLLLDAPGWRDLSGLWDLTIKLDVPRDALRARLLERWRTFGYSPEDAMVKADENDLPNADLVNNGSLKPDILVQNLKL